MKRTGSVNRWGREEEEEGRKQTGERGAAERPETDALRGLAGNAVWY